MKIVTINTYAGSLLQGAKIAGLEVEASLEDSLFGVDAQNKNFPDLPVFSDVAKWPELDLSGRTVIAHPPCSAFSSLTRGSKNRGPDSDAFKCTITALDYAGKHGAENVAVESVCRAAEGGKEVHEMLARRYGYNIYRVFLNAVTFGIPQWRPRFWIVFSKRSELSFKYEIVLRTLKDVVVDDGGEPDNQYLDRQIHILTKKGLGPEAVSVLLNDEPWGHLRKSLPEISKEDLQSWMYTKFSVNQWIKLNPDGFSPTIIGSAQWLWRGKPLSTPNWKRVMGFPGDYWMPERKTKNYLSKGVCPPIAAWVLSNLVQPPTNPSHKLKSGSTLDLRVKRSIQTSF